MPPLKIGSSPRRRRSPIGSCNNANNKSRFNNQCDDERFSPSIFGENGLPFPQHHQHLDFSSKPATTNLKTTTKPIEPCFDDHLTMGKRISKSLYFHKLPATPRASLPLTVLAVKTFTNEVFGNSDTLEFLDLEMASEIGRNACVSPTTLIMALVYLERLSTHNPSYLSSVKPSELFVVSLLVASKFMQDDGEDYGVYNDEWATSSKMDLKHINRLELQFLDAINWSINVTKDEFNRVLAGVEQKLALNQGLGRGWFTYTEMGSLSELIFTWNVIGPTIRDYLLQVVTAVSMTYTALIATVLSSSFLGPKMFALTKTMLLSSSIFHSQTQTGSLCSGFNNNITGFDPAITKLPHTYNYPRQQQHPHLRQQQLNQEQLLDDSDLADAQAIALESILNDGKETNATDLNQQQLLNRLNINRLVSLISQQRYKHGHHSSGYKNPVGTLSVRDNYPPNRHATRIGNNKGGWIVSANSAANMEDKRGGEPFCDVSSNDNKCKKFDARYVEHNLWNSGNPLEFSNYIKV